MNKIPFPTQYKKAILNKTKNTTIRIGEGLGKYKIGQVYSAESYAGKSWNTKLKIVNVNNTSVEKLGNFGIPKRSIEAIKKKDGVNIRTRAEIIRFTYV